MKSSSTSISTTSTQPTATPHVNTDLWIGASSVVVVLLALSAVFGYRRYRSVQRRQQIAMLERLWLMNSIDRTT